MAGGYLRVAGVLRGTGGKVIVHGGLQDISITSSSQRPVMSVTSWRGSSEAVDESGKGVVSVPSPVDDIDIVPSPEDVVSLGERLSEELASVESVESPVRVLTTVVTTFVLVWLPDAPEMLTAVIVLTTVVTTCALV